MSKRLLIPERGYLLPDIIDPGELVCVQLYIPNDDYYIRALSGHLELLATWKEWEKDGTSRASQAAQVWKDALDYTHENGWIGACGMDAECCQAIVDAINNISITVNVNASGGGGCCSLDKVWKLPDGFENTLPTEYPPIGNETTSLIPQELCDQAHKTWAGIREFFDNYADLVDEIQPYDELLAFVIGIGILALPPPAALMTILTLGAGALYALLENDTLDFWDDMKQDFVCAMVNHHTPGSFYSWLVDYVDQNSPNIFVQEWMQAVLQMPEWTLIYDGVYAIPPEFENSDCSGCEIASIWAVEEAESIIDESSSYILTGAIGNGFRISGTIVAGTSTDNRIVLYVPSLALTEMQKVTFNLRVQSDGASVPSSWGAPGSTSPLINGSFDWVSVIIHDGTHDDTGYDLAIVKTAVSNKAYFWHGIFTFQPPNEVIDIIMTDFTYLEA